MIKKQCDKCDKVIEGYTESQVDYMMAQHNLSKHPEKQNAN
ncbi:hypothetical protein LCGC14_0569970 [marine sediment metagenome]|uniref:Uncharacterized protein n=1 Tax=marine sediment metagenome TaxID=412755 RepID=A0A0F9RJI3_9ZZZZ